MSIDTNFGLLSSTGTKSLQNFMQSAHMSNLTGVSLKNEYTGEYCGFDFKNMFSNSSGVQASGSIFGCGYAQNTIGSGTRLPAGPVSSYTSRDAIPQTSQPYANGRYGSSIVGNYYNSINTVALGQPAPTSVFEQRLAYHFGYTNGFPKGGQMNGDFANFFNIDSSTVAKSASSNTSGNASSNSYDVFSAAAAKSAVSGSLSSMMSKLNIIS